MTGFTHHPGPDRPPCGTDMWIYQGATSAAIRAQRLNTLRLMAGRLEHVAQHLPHVPGRRQAATDAEAIRWALAQLGVTDPGADAA